MEHNKEPFGDSLAEFFNTVAEMRDAQKSYFKTRSKDDLKRSKELERKVDAMIQYVRSPKIMFQDEKTEAQMLRL